MKTITEATTYWNNTDSQWDYRVLVTDDSEEIGPWDAECNAWQNDQQKHGSILVERE